MIKEELMSIIGSFSRSHALRGNERKIVNEPFLNEKLELLKSHVNDLLNIEDVNFSKCEDVKNCLFCDYKIVCGRE